MIIELRKKESDGIKTVCTFGGDLSFRFDEAEKKLNILIANAPHIYKVDSVSFSLHGNFAYFILSDDDKNF